MRIYLDQMKEEFTSEEYNMISEYMDKCNTFVFREGNKYIISGPEDWIEFTSKSELIEDVKYNIECIREMGV